jgi:hypothetical protein
MYSSYWDCLNFSFSQSFSSGEIGAFRGLPWVLDAVGFVVKWASPPINLEIKSTIRAGSASIKI